MSKAIILPPRAHSVIGKLPWKPKYNMVPHRYLMNKGHGSHRERRGGVGVGIKEDLREMWPSMALKELLDGICVKKALQVEGSALKDLEL